MTGDEQFNTIGSFAVKNGLMMSIPYKLVHQGLWFARLGSRTTSHILLTGSMSPQSTRRRNRILTDFRTHSLLTVIDLSSETPIDNRRTLDRIARRIRKDSVSPVLVIIDGIDAVFSGVRSVSSQNRVKTNLRTVFEHGPAQGVHVLLNQPVNNKDMRIGGISDHFEVVLSSSRLTPLCSQLVFNDAFGTTIPARGFMGLKDGGLKRILTLQDQS